MKWERFFKAISLVAVLVLSFGVTSVVIAGQVPLTTPPVTGTGWFYKAIGIGYVDGAPNTTNGDWVQLGGNGVVGGNRTADTTPRATYVEGQSAWSQATTHTAGADLNVAAGLGRRKVALTATNCTGNYVRFVIEGTTTTLTEGTDWSKGSSDTAAATSLKAAINSAIATVVATSSSGTVYVQRNQSTANGGAADMTLSTDDVTCASITAGTDGAINFWQAVVLKAGEIIAGALDVAGNFSVATNKFTVAAASGNTLAAGTLSSTGDFAVNTNKFTVGASTGNTLAAGTLSSTGDFAVATNKFTVAAASGNTLVAGTLSATGDVAVNTNKFTVAASTGNTLAAGTLSSTGDFAVATNKFTVAAASGNTVVAGTLKGTATTLGWSYFTGANTACTTTCSGHGACVNGIETTAGEVGVVCTDATADKCLCTN